MPNIVELSVGTDTVHVIGERVLIFAKRPMPDWTVRDYSRLPIYFQGAKYFLKRKTPGPPPFAFHYELAPWLDEPGLESTLSITYDEAYVAERDGAHRANRKDEAIYPALVCIYPLLGLAWSGFKIRVLSPLGFDSPGITAASTLFELCCFMLEGVFVFYFSSGFIAPFCGPHWYDKVIWFDRALAVLLPLDAAIRYSQVIRGDEELDGFMEWAFRAVFRRPSR